MSGDIVCQVAQVEKDGMKSWMLAEMVSLMGPLVDLLFVKFTHKVSSAYRQQQLIGGAGDLEPTVNPFAAYPASPNPAQLHQQLVPLVGGGPERTVNPSAVYFAPPNPIQVHQQQQMIGGGDRAQMANPSASFSTSSNPVQLQQQQQQLVGGGAGCPEPTVNPTAVYSSSPNLSQVRQEQPLVGGGGGGGGGGDLAPTANPESASYSASPNPVHVSHQQQQLVGGGGGGPEPTVNPSAFYSALPNQIQGHQPQQQQQLASGVGGGGGGPVQTVNPPTASYSGPPNIQSIPSAFAICLPSQSPTERVAIDGTIEIDHAYPAQTYVQYSTGLEPEDDEEILREVKREIEEEEEEMRRIAAQEMPFAGNDSISFNQAPSGQEHHHQPQSQVSSHSVFTDQLFHSELAAVTGNGLAQSGSNCAQGREMHLQPLPGQKHSQTQPQVDLGSYSADDQMGHSELTATDNGHSQSNCNRALGENMQDQSPLAQQQQQSQTSTLALTHMEQMPNSDNGHTQFGRNFALGSDPQSPSGHVQPQPESSQDKSRSSTTGHMHHHLALTVTDKRLSRSSSNRGRKNSPHQPPRSDHQANPKTQSHASSLATYPINHSEAAAAAGNGVTPSSSNRAKGRETNRQPPPDQGNPQSHANTRSLAINQVDHSEAVTALDNKLSQPGDCSRSQGANMQDHQSSTGQILAQQPQPQINTPSVTTDQMHNSELTGSGRSRSGHSNRTLRNDKQTQSSQEGPLPLSQDSSRSSATGLLRQSALTDTGGNESARSLGSNRALGKEKHRQPHSDQVNLQTHSQTNTRSRDQVNHSESATAAAAADNGQSRSGSNRSQGKKMPLQPAPSGQVPHEPQSQAASLRTDSANQMRHSELTENDGQSRAGCSNRVLGNNKQTQTQSGQVPQAQQQSQVNWRPSRPLERKSTHRQPPPPPPDQVNRKTQSRTNNTSSHSSTDQIDRSDLSPTTTTTTDKGQTLSGRNHALDSEKDTQSASGQSQSKQVYSRPSTTEHLFHSELAAADYRLSQLSKRSQGRKVTYRQPSDQVLPQQGSSTRTLRTDQVSHSESAPAAAATTTDNGLSRPRSILKKGREMHPQKHTKRVHFELNPFVRWIGDESSEENSRSSSGKPLYRLIPIQGLPQSSGSNRALGSKDNQSQSRPMQEHSHSSQPSKRPRLAVTEEQARVVREANLQALTEYKEAQTLDIANANVPFSITVELKCFVSECNEMFVCKGEFYKHMQNVHSIWPFMCAVRQCRKSFNESSKLEEHIKEHGNNNKWYCDKCSFPFRTYRTLSNHTHFFHQHGVFQCVASGCDFTDNCKGRLYEHYDYEHKVKSGQSGSLVPASGDKRT